MLKISYTGTNFPAQFDGTNFPAQFEKMIVLQECLCVVVPEQKYNNFVSEITLT